MIRVYLLIKRYAGAKIHTQKSYRKPGKHLTQCVTLHYEARGANHTAKNGNNHHRPNHVHYAEMTYGHTHCQGHKATHGGHVSRNFPLAVYESTYYHGQHCSDHKHHEPHWCLTHIQEPGASGIAHQRYYIRQRAFILLFECRIREMTELPQRPYTHKGHHAYHQCHHTKHPQSCAQRKHAEHTQPQCYGHAVNRHYGRPEHKRY